MGLFGNSVGIPHIGELTGRVIGNAVAFNISVTSFFINGHRIRVRENRASDQQEKKKNRCCFCHDSKEKKKKESKKGDSSKMRDRLNKKSVAGLYSCNAFSAIGSLHWTTFATGL